MGGDGGSGLALAIALTSVAMVLGLVAGAVLLGRRLRVGATTGVLLGLAGLVCGVLAVVATFHETLWSPPPSVRLILPPGFAHASVILLEDPAKGHAVAWSGSALPFSGKTATLDIPTSGVLRVRNFGPLAGRADIAGNWADGMSLAGAGGGPALPELNAAGYIVLMLRQDPADALPHDREAIARYIGRRERD